MSAELIEDFKKRYFELVEKSFVEFRDCFITSVSDDSYSNEYHEFVCKVWKEALIIPDPGGFYNWKHYRVFWGKYPFILGIINKKTDETEIICKDFILYPDLENEINA